MQRLADYVSAGSVGVAVAESAEQELAQLRQEVVTLRADRHELVSGREELRGAVEGECFLLLWS